MTIAPGPAPAPPDLIPPAKIPPAFARLGPAIAAVAPRLTPADVAIWVGSLVGPMQECGMVTTHRIAAAIGQFAVESAYFTRLSENLDYSTAARLLEVFGSHVHASEAASFLHAPERLANRVYANRYGNGSEASGDGWRFRGGGIVQTTFRANYAALAAAFPGHTAETAADWVRTPSGAAVAACFYWSSHKLNAMADAWAVMAITKAIQGGYGDLEARARMSQAAFAALSRPG